MTSIAEQPDFNLPTLSPPLALIVEVDTSFLLKLRQVVERAGYEALTHSDFQIARSALYDRRPAALVANIRLGSFNGIHLAYLARLTNPRIRVVIYDSLEDQSLARETQRAGAFYERLELLPFSLTNLLTARLPERDRRDVGITDRRKTFRGGGRATDVAVLHSPR